MAIALRCPIYDSTTACDTHKDCLLRRNAGCALVLAATIGEENRKHLQSVEAQLGDVQRKLNVLINAAGR